MSSSIATIHETCSGCSPRSGDKRVKRLKKTTKAQGSAFEDPNALVSYSCPRCGQWLCDALPGASVLCEKCRAWTPRETVPPLKGKRIPVRTRPPAKVDMEKPLCSQVPEAKTHARTGSQGVLAFCDVTDEP